MDYDQFVDLDNVTLLDCCELYNYKNIKTVIEDGRITDFVKENE